MDLRLTAILAIFAGVLSIGLFWDGTQSQHIYIQHDHEFAVENVPHRHHPFVSQTNRFDTPVVRPVALSLQMEPGPSIVPIRTVAVDADAPEGWSDDTITQWFSALVSGLVSIILGVMILIFADVRFTGP